MTILLILVLLALLLVAGVPIGYSMAIAGTVGLFAEGGWTAVSGILSTSPYRVSASWVLTALPLFLLMAEFISSSGLAMKLYNAAYKWLSWLPGSLAISTIFSTAAFGAISGSSTAATATMTRTAVPEMLRYGYDPRLALGVVATAGTLAMMIPPSVVLIIYGILTETSIGSLFIAAIIPGILTAVVYAALTIIWVKMRPDIAPSRRVPSLRTADQGSQTMSPAESSISGETFTPDDGDSQEQETGPELGEVDQLNTEPLFSWSEKFSALGEVYPVLILFFLVMGGIYSGAVTITEAAAVGAVGALGFAVLSGNMSLRDFFAALKSTTRVTAMIFMIIIGAHILGFFFTLTRVTPTLLNFIGDLGVSPWIIMVIFLCLYIFLGFFMDQLAILVLTVPIVLPIVTGLGFDAIWFGIVIVKTIEIGLATPPLGLNVFVAGSISNLPLSVGFRGAARYVMCDILVLAVMVAFPAMVLWLVP